MCLFRFPPGSGAGSRSAAQPQADVNVPDAAGSTRRGHKEAVLLLLSPEVRGRSPFTPQREFLAHCPRPLPTPPSRARSAHGCLSRPPSYLDHCFDKETKARRSHSRGATPLIIDWPFRCRRAFCDKASASPFVTINNAPRFLRVPVSGEVPTLPAGPTLPSRRLPGFRSIFSF